MSNLSKLKSNFLERKSFKLLTHVDYIKTVETMKKNKKNVKGEANNGKTKFENEYTGFSRSIV